MLDLAKRYAAPVPRYTSYPTAPHFSNRIGQLQAVDWLAALPRQVALSLYVHIPFCRALCWYCGCNTTVTNRQAPVAAYLDALGREMTNVASLVTPDHTVGHVHWGGGSPDLLLPADILRLAERIRSLFKISDTAEFAVEIDPRGLDIERVRAFRAAGVNRASIGIQDFDPQVQKAINRHQSYETTRQSVAMLREAGIASINMDLVYGLPHQTRQSVAKTLEQVLTLEPDRVAIFGYAHLPSRIRHQRLIDDTTLAGPVDRLGQANRMARILEGRGFVRIGLDHFAKPGDALAAGEVRRNFQGYTTDQSDALIGMGASAISRFPEGYTQNETSVPAYERLIQSEGLATVRGVALSGEDQMRGFVIERLMCELAFSERALRERFGEAASPLIEEAAALIESDQDGLIERTADGFRVTDRGRPFVRSICGCFDAYLGQGEARHSTGI